MSKSNSLFHYHLPLKSHVTIHLTQETIKKQPKLTNTYLMKINSRIATTKTNNVIIRGMVITSTGMSFDIIIDASSVKKELSVHIF